MRFPWSALPFALILFSCRTANQSDLSSEVPKPLHLALGDSVAFGYDPLIPMTDENVAAGKFTGYPETIAEMLNFKLTNISCSGETTGSLIDRTARSNGCREGEERYDEHLKVEYSINQLDYAINFLKENPDTKLVTLTIGGNDILIAENDCNKTIVPTPCKATKVPWLLVTLGKNMKKIIEGLQSSGYKGPIVFVTNYARNYKDPVQTAVLSSIQLEMKLITRYKNVKLASGYDAFARESKDFDGDSCKAGLMINLPEGGCDQHPSEKGRKVLAQAVIDAMNSPPTK